MSNCSGTWLSQRATGLLGLAAFLALGANANAALVGVNLHDYPDLTSQFIFVEYDAASDVLLASGFALTLDDDGMGPAENIAGGSFELELSIDENGVFGGGTLEIGGTIASLGYNSGNLLSGTISDFGYAEDGSGVLDFLFEVSGGDAMALYAGLPTGGIMTFTGFTGSWASSFTNGGTGNADVAPVPVPAALWLLLSAIGAVAGLRRR